MNNNFDSLEIARWYCFNSECWWCEESHANCMHHVDGRVGDGNDSILNSAPLNNSICHLPIHGILRKRENQVILLGKTYKYLRRQGYQLNDSDRLFISKHKDIYQEILNNEKREKQGT